MKGVTHIFTSTGTYQHDGTVQMKKELEETEKKKYQVEKET